MGVFKVKSITVLVIMHGVEALQGVSFSWHTRG